jgi:TonB family protein
MLHLALFMHVILTLQAPPTPARLVFEGAQRPHFTRTSEYVELRSGRGRLRIAEVYADFAMTLEFRLGEEETEAEVVLEGWKNGDLRIALPGTRRKVNRDLVEARGTPVRPHGRGAIVPSAPNVWHRLDLRVAGREMVVAINGAEAGRYEIVEFAGFISFRTGKGKVQLRSIHSQPLSPVRGDDSTVYPFDTFGLTGPSIEREVKPDYTVEAFQAKIEGVVTVEAIVEPDGRVSAVRVVRGVEPGLDQKAIEAVGQWRFKPGLRAGRPVPVLVTIELTFTMK